MPTGDVLVTIARLLLASVFLMAGLVKLKEGHGFLNTVRNLGLLPDPLVKPFVRLLPWAELAASALLFAGLYIVVASLLLLFLCGAFVGATVYAIQKRLNLNCGCFGLLYRETLGLTTLIRDAVLLLICISLALFDQGTYALVRLLGKPENLLNMVMILVTLGTFLASIAMAHRAAGFSLRLPRSWRLGSEVGT